MQRTCIVVVDASRARLFLFDRTAEPAGLREELIETTDLVNPARRTTRAERVSDRGFAKLIAQEVQRLIVSPQVQRLIVCASPHMLGELRQVAHTFERSGLEIAEVPRDLVTLSPPELRERLGDYGVLPA